MHCINLLSLSPSTISPLASCLLPTSSSLVTDAARPVNIICHSTAATRERHSLRFASHINSTLDEKRLQRVFGQDGTCFAEMVVFEYCQRSIWEKDDTAADGGILRWAKTHSHSSRRKAGTMFWQRWERFCCGQCEQLVSSLYCPLEEKALWLVSTVTLNLWSDVD